MDHNENFKLEMLAYYLKAIPQHHLNSNLTGFTPSPPYHPLVGKIPVLGKSWPFSMPYIN